MTETETMKGKILKIGMMAMAVALVLCSCSKKKKSSFDPAKVGFEVSYSQELDNTLYPSFILGLANYNGKQNSEMFRYAVTNPKRNSVLRIVMDSSQLNYTTIFQETMAENGVRYTFEPLVKWKYGNLAHVRQSGMVDLTFTCYINDEEVDVKNLRLNYRPVNECLLGVYDTCNHYVDHRWMFAAFVNEEHPFLDLMLNEILEQGIVSRFTGYQLGEKQVDEQVFAIWYYVQTRGIHYSSISSTSRASKRANTQNIRFLDEVYRNKQANCIDACAFMASILKKIGIKPVIFLEPSHAYLGYYKDKNKKKLALLETTLAGNIDFTGIDAAYDSVTVVQEMMKYSKYMVKNEIYKYQNKIWTRTDVKKSISRESFRQATNKNIERYNKNKKNFKDASQELYSILDISELREMVQPINRDEDIPFVQDQTE